MSAVSQFPQPGPGYGFRCFPVSLSIGPHRGKETYTIIWIFLLFCLSSYKWVPSELRNPMQNHEVTGRRVRKHLHGKLLELSKWKTTHMSVDMGFPGKQNVVQMPSLLNAYCRSSSVINSGISLKWMFVFWAGQVAVVLSVSGGTYSWV